MYLPLQIDGARVLITVKTYPNPSAKYDELVCNAGILSTGQWIRIYPINFRGLPYDQQYKKFDWVNLDLVKQTSDFRQESYRPRMGIEEKIETVGHIGTGKHRDWGERKRLVLGEVFTSMNELITLSKEQGIWKSLATVKPREIVKFEIASDTREWKPKYQEELRQMKLFSNTQRKNQKEFEVVKKIPYRYYYHFLTDGDNKPRRMMIEDWEVGALYWKCLAKTEGDEQAANQLVRKKFEQELVSKDLYFFVGTTKANHIRGKNPFVIIGAFYPPHTSQMRFNL